LSEFAVLSNLRWTKLTVPISGGTLCAVPACGNASSEACTAR
jgi:hypothetical protein